MSTAETLYLALVLGTFAVFSVTLAWQVFAYDRSKQAAPAARRDVVTQSGHAHA